MMQKRNYEKVTILVTKFESEDIVTTSVTDGIGISFDQGKWGVTTEEVFN